MADPSSDPGTTLEGILKQRRRKAIRNGAIVVMLLLVIGLGAWWGFVRSSEPAASPAPAPVVTPLARREPPPPTPEPVIPMAPPPVAKPPPAPTPLPDLDASDALVRDVAGTLSSHADVMTWLAPEELVRRFVAAVDNVAEGRSPAGQLGSLRPGKRFGVTSDGDRVTADPAAFARYDTLTEVIVATDTGGAVRAYQRLRPLIDEAYRDLGYPDRSFDEALHAAIAELLATPVVVGEPELAPKVVTHTYTDPDLEGLSAAQKQLLRFGPVNAPRVQRKLRDIAAALGISAAELPLTPLHQVPREAP